MSSSSSKAGKKEAPAPSEEEEKLVAEMKERHMTTRKKRTCEEMKEVLRNPRKEHLKQLTNVTVVVYRDKAGRAKTAICAHKTKKLSKVGRFYIIFPTYTTRHDFEKILDKAKVLYHEAEVAEPQETDKQKPKPPRKPKAEAKAEESTGKYAVIIGNAEYEDDSLGPLPGCVDDAEFAARVFKKLGYEVVNQKTTNLSYKDIRMAVFQLAPKIRTARRVVFYFSGHGGTVNNKTGDFMAPMLYGADGKAFSCADDLIDPINASLNDVFQSENSQPPDDFFFAMILDCCRSEGTKEAPVADPTGRWGASAMATTAASNCFVFHPCAPGKTSFAASTNFKQKGSRFSVSLLQVIDQFPNLDASAAFRRARKATLEDSGGEQEPWLEESVSDPSTGANPIVFSFV